MELSAAMRASTPCRREVVEAASQGKEHEGVRALPRGTFYMYTQSFCIPASILNEWPPMLGY